MNYSVQYTKPDGSTFIDPAYATNAPAHLIQCVGKLFQLAIEESQTIEIPQEFKGKVNPRVTRGFPIGSGWRNDQIAGELHSVIKAGEALDWKISLLASSGFTLASTKLLIANEIHAFIDLRARVARRIAMLYAILVRYDEWSDFEVVLLALMQLQKLEGAAINYEELIASYALQDEAEK